MDFFFVFYIGFCIWDRALRAWLRLATDFFLHCFSFSISINWASFPWIISLTNIYERRFLSYSLVSHFSAVGQKKSNTYIKIYLFIYLFSVFQEKKEKRENANKWQFQRWIEEYIFYLFIIIIIIESINLLTSFLEFANGIVHTYHCFFYHPVATYRQMCNERQQKPKKKEKLKADFPYSHATTMFISLSTQCHHCYSKRTLVWQQEKKLCSSVSCIRFERNRITRK